jgi:septum site-determining protein MinD
LGELIAVVSGKGGTGKTSVCAGIATALAESGKRVLCVDCDVGLRNLDISLGMSDCGGLSFLDVSEFGYELENAPHHPIYDNLSFLTAPMNRSPEDINTESFIALFQRARERFDYIFLDAPAGVDAGFRLVCAAADSFLVVTGAGPAAVRDAARVGELLELAGKTNAKLIVNRVDKDLLSTVRLTIDDVMDTAGLPLLGIVLEDCHVTLAAAFGLPLLKYASRCEATRDFRRIAARLQGYHKPIPWR